MSFFLLGQGRDSLDLRLISDQVFSSRQEAMAELSRLTARSDFPHWDAEVFVMDLDAGTPVLLVKPASAPAEELPDVEQTIEETAAAEVEPGEDVAAEDDDAAAVVSSEDDGETPEADSIDEEPPAGSDEIPAEATESAPEIMADETAAAWETPEADADDAPVGEDEDDSLAQAIKRATGALESEGIVAPDSIGPADPVDDAPATEAPAEPASAAWPWAVDGSTQTTPVVDTAGSADVSGDDEPDGIETAPETSADIEPELAAEPDAVESAPQPEPYVPSPFEEPEIDVQSEGMVTLPADIAETDSAGPVILGDYRDNGIAGDLIIDDGSDTAVIAARDVDSAIVVDGPDISTSTCAECVYMDTCPNKGELDPKSCGSFQWK